MKKVVFTKRPYTRAPSAVSREGVGAVVPVQMDVSSFARRRRNIRTGGFLGIERKFMDAYASNLAIPGPVDCAGGEMQPEGGCTECISAPAQGDGEEQRDGRKIVIKSCFVNCTVQTTAASDQADVLKAPQIFIALVLDTQANGATVVSEQVFKNPNDTAAVNTFPLRNLQYSSRYRVLAHKTLSMAPVTAVTDGANTSSQICPTKTCTLSWTGDLPVTFTSTTSNVANVADNALHIIAFATSTTFQPALSYNSRIRFVG